MKILKAKLDQYFEYMIIGLLFIIAFGIPLVFTSYTRSVFEVNKLMLLRVASMLVIFIWIFRYLLYKDNGINVDIEKSATRGGYRWLKTGLEVPIILWIGINIISTILSQNIRLSLIGSYDRWEGLFTILGYVILLVMFMKQVNKRKYLHWILAGILSSTAISAVYGIFQSLGYDFMNWSVDPTMRVFACINNPVHYCAYVAMTVPLGIGWLIFISSKEQFLKKVPSWLEIVKWMIFFSTMLIYYNQFLSYSRATWMGFVGAMTLFYLIVTHNFRLDSEKNYLIDFALTSFGIAVFYLIAIFQLQEKSLMIASFVWSGVILYLLGTYFVTGVYKIEKKYQLLTILFLAISYFVAIFDFSQLGGISEFLKFGINLGLIIALMYLIVLQKISQKENAKVFISRILIILIFTKLQFVAVSWTSMILYFSLVYAYYLLALKNNSSLFREKKFWLLVFLLFFAIVIIIPTLPVHVSKLTHWKATGSLKAIGNVEQKVSSYSSVAIKGTARTSMWKSAIPWIKDYWLVGSGPDTVKYLFPVYRRPEYGKLEGGHNYTPDRLHNEYLNTLATRGVLGFLIYYVGLIGMWFVLVLKGLFKRKNNPYQYIIAGLMAGVTIYLGQVMFNFGVVATLVLFYILMGLAMAVINFSDFDVEKIIKNE